MSGRKKAPPQGFDITDARVFDGLPVGLFCTNKGGEFLYVNKTFAELLGYSLDEIRRIRSWDLYEQRAGREAWLAQVDRHGDYRAWLRWLTKRGEPLVVNNHAQKARLSDGREVYVGIVEAAAPRPQLLEGRTGWWTEEAILGGELDDYFDNLAIYVVYKDQAGRIRFANRAFRDREAECTRDELTKETLTDRSLYPDDLARRYRQDDEVVLTTGVTLEFTEPHTRGRRRGGQEPPVDLAAVEVRVPVHVLKMPVHASDGRRCGVLCLFWEEVEAGGAMQKAVQWAQQESLISAQVFQIIYEHDMDGRFTKLNEEGQRLTGYTEDDFTRLKLEDVVAPAYRPVTAKMMRLKSASQEPLPLTRYGIEIIGKDGKTIPLEVVSVLVKDGGRAPYVRGHARDLRAECRAEDRVRDGVRREFESVLASIAVEQARVVGSETRQMLRRIEARLRWRLSCLVNRGGVPGSAAAEAGVAASMRARLEYLAKLRATEVPGVSIRTKCPEDLVLPRPLLDDCVDVVLGMVESALDHAFPYGRRGQITVSLTEGQGGAARIAVDDDGANSRDSYAARMADLGPVREVVLEYGGALDILPLQEGGTRMFATLVAADRGRAAPP